MVFRSERSKKIALSSLALITSSLILCRVAFYEGPDRLLPEKEMRQDNFGPKYVPEPAGPEEENEREKMEEKPQRYIASRSYVQSTQTLKKLLL